MHGSALREMARFVQGLPDSPLKIADVGSLDVNGSYRPLFSNPLWTYTGLDIVGGSNVDVILEGENEWANIADESYDVIVSGSAMEHTRLPWIFMKNVARIARKGARICVIAPYAWGYHAYPVDCWRVYPDGMRAVMEYCGLSVVEAYMVADDHNKECGDSVGVARK